MNSIRNTGGRHIRIGLTVAVLAVSAITCSPFRLFDSQDDAGTRVETLEAELQEARGTATSQAAVQVAEEEDARQTRRVETSFEEDQGLFAIGPAESISEGGLLIGPYELCANDVGNFDQPVGCLTVCQECGANLSEYELEVKFTFEDGLTDREFGVVLRFVDENQDSMLDRPDYLLALGFNIYQNRWRLYLHEPDRIEPWRVIASGDAGFLRAGRMNELEVLATEDGQLIEIRMNERFLTLLTGDTPEPGERLVQPWASSGSVGLIGLGRGVQARFDDFVLIAEE